MKEIAAAVIPVDLLFAFYPPKKCPLLCRVEFYLQDNDICRPIFSRSVNSSHVGWSKKVGHKRSVSIDAEQMVGLIVGGTPPRKKKKKRLNQSLQSNYGVK